MSATILNFNDYKKDNSKLSLWYKFPCNITSEFKDGDVLVRFFDTNVCLIPSESDIYVLNKTYENNQNVMWAHMYDILNILDNNDLIG